MPLRAGVVVAGLALAEAGAGLAGCRDAPESRPPGADRGSVTDGAAAIDTYGCGACHTIPGIPRADSMVGPPLTDWSERSFVAGTLPNNSESLVTWLLDPDSVRPGTAMPDLGLSEGDARDIAAYLLDLG